VKIIDLKSKENWFQIAILNHLIWNRTQHWRVRQCRKDTQSAHVTYVQCARYVIAAVLFKFAFSSLTVGTRKSVALSKAYLGRHIDLCYTISWLLLE